VTGTTENRAVVSLCAMPDLVTAICTAGVLAWLIALAIVGWITSEPSDPSTWPKAAQWYYAANPEAGQRAIDRERQNRRAYFRVMSLVILLIILFVSLLR